MANEKPTHGLWIGFQTLCELFCIAWFDGWQSPGPGPDIVDRLQEAFGDIINRSGAVDASDNAEFDILFDQV